MTTFKTPFLLIVVISFLVISTYAQNAPQDYLNTHNTARALVGVANVVWDTALAAYATNYANARKVDCSLTPSNGPYGENLANGPNIGFTGVSAVNLWVAQKDYYNHTINSCIGTYQCKHYTQVVWSNSVKIGCARVACNNNAGYFVGCNYDAPEGSEQKRPYKKAVLAFAAALESRKITASVRQTRGLDASAACAEDEEIEARMTSDVCFGL
ncbi:CAP superfamily [Arabidopsis suecica]|uniref:CAP superfamily n=1 Tax=Arabidopsis suecica TaxID=45249 RepID=A0A8T2CNW6_ARASU|nr:CAP superfamily [Arabidopsis suecica]